MSKKLNTEKVGSILTALTQTLESRKESDPESSYVAKLLNKGEDSILKKIGEEATEVVISAKGDTDEHTVYEIADLWFHTLVLLAQKNCSAEDVLNELERRFGLSGIEEKNSRA